MINGPSVYDSGVFVTIRPYFKACLSKSYTDGEGQMVAKTPESYTEGPFIIFYGRKSIFGRKLNKDEDQ